MLHEQHAPPQPEEEPAAAEVVHALHLPSAPATTGDAAAARGGEHHHHQHRDDEPATFRDIHPLTPSPTPPARLGSASWDTASHRSLSSEEQFMTMSREFTAMVAAGTTLQTGANGYDASSGADQLTSIGEDELEETNPLAIVPDSHPIATPARSRASLEVVPAGPSASAPAPPPVEARQVKKEEVETKVSAWQTAEVAKINNRFKREEVVINGWETEQVEKASAWLKKIERKLDEQRAKAIEKTQNDMAKARRKAEEKRASAEAKRGLKLAKVLELANFMKAVGRVPTKRSFF
ncbi:remorin 4.1-like [Oryza brachyantha]|uniref:remorin 4.1-like n=1 Tax=Oryza brachyantha TaxID=4533 RepID=UPI001ADA3E1E|nr:remorin 4.1-like [Oryza brachyantha]